MRIWFTVRVWYGPTKKIEHTCRSDIRAIKTRISSTPDTEWATILDMRYDHNKLLAIFFLCVFILLYFSFRPWNRESLPAGPPLVSKIFGACIIWGRKKFTIGFFACFRMYSHCLDVILQQIMHVSALGECTMKLVWWCVYEEGISWFVALIW